ncbi:hypothetical protein LOZ66_006608 [Ophidiomyces ophidiicola]|nr:hypothetical protein LOZ66_006608 [Ophidiomyces ophidiicola]
MSDVKDIPDAWDDDWDQIDARRPDPSSPPPAPQQEPEKKLSSRAKKAQLRAQHAEFNRQLWAEAEAEAYVSMRSPLNQRKLTLTLSCRFASEPTQISHFLDSRSAIPLRTEYKPAVKVLSRNPQSGVDAATIGFQRVTISPRPAINSNNQNEAEDGDDSDSESQNQKPLTAEERHVIAKREREEKQRKYEEARERLFGSSNAGSGASSPGSTTPPRQQHAGEGRWKGKGRSNANCRDRGDKREPRNAKGKQLFDPNSSPKPASNGKRKETKSQPQSPPPQVPIRSPRGPEESGPGGFGFAQRGGNTALHG